MERVIKEHTFFDNLLREEIAIIDLGACKGEFTIEMDSLYKVKKSILVEANPTNFKQLPVKSNYVLYNNVVSNLGDLEVDFFEDPKSPYNGSMVFNYFNGINHKIKTITLDKLLEENNIDYIDILKIDIEGSEYDLLENINEKILYITKQITVEFHDFVNPKLKGKTDEIMKKIESFGFNRISKPIVHMHNSDNYDVLFYKQ